MPGVSQSPSFTVEYFEPEAIEAEQLPEEFDTSHLRRSLLLIAGAALVVVALIALVPGLASLRERFAGGEPGWLAVAAALKVVSCASYVVAFRGVFCSRMRWNTSSQIGLSELAANSLLSVGGAGGLALGAWILRRGGMDTGHIARRTVAFFLLTSLVNVSFLILCGLALATGVLAGSPTLLLALVPALVGVAAICVALAAGWAAHALARHTGRPGLERILRTIGAGVEEAVELLRSRDWMVLAGALGYMLFDVAALGFCFVAFGNDVPAVGVLVLAYVIGLLGGLIPLPGGIGGVDAGLIGTLVVYGVEPADAAVAVVAYRGIVLAVPALLGLPALEVLRRRLRTEEHDIAACTPGQEVEVLGRGQVSPWRRVSQEGA